MRQDTAFFDAALPGEHIVAATEDIDNFERGISQKLCEAVQASAQFVIGFVVAFYYSWKLAFVCLGAVPLMGGTAAFLFSGGGKNSDGVLGQAAYTDAGSVASEAIAAIRTIASFGGEVATSKKYDSLLTKARKAAIKESLRLGIGFGGLFGIMFAMYGLGFWFGGTVIRSSRIESIDLYAPPASLISNVSGPYEFNYEFMIKPYCEGNLSLSGTGLKICACTVPPPASSGLPTPDCGCLHEQDDSFLASSHCQDIATITTAFFAFIIGGFACGQLAPALTAFKDARRSAAKLFAVIDRQPPIDIEAGGKTFEMKGKIDINNVAFSYPGRDIFKGSISTFAPEKQSRLWANLAAENRRLGGLWRGFTTPRRAPSRSMALTLKKWM